MKVLKKILCIALPIIIIAGGFLGLVGAGVFNKFSFTVDTSQTRNEISNTVSNVNIWSIEGNPFVNAHINKDYNIFEFVEYVQFMQCSGGTEARDLFKDPLDKTVLDDYDFTVLIENCRGVVNMGAKPMLKLGSVPLKYSKNATTEHGFGMNPYPPDDYNVYYDYIYAIGKALVDEFGKEEVLSWRFGVMTEYENYDWFIAEGEDPDKTAEEYCKLYDYTVQALIDSIGEEVFVGAHSMTVTEGHWDEEIFIKHCAEGKNYKTGKTGTRLCYLSASFYDSAPGDYTDGKTLPETIDYLRTTAEKYGFNNLIYGIDEGRILVGTTSGKDNDELLTRTVGYLYQAAYNARLTKQMFENGIDYFSAWSYLSGGFTSGNPTVSYHVAKRASEMAGSKLVSTTADKKGIIFGGEVDAVSAFNEETNTLHVMAYNFKNNLEYNTDAEITFNINVPQFEDGKAKITVYKIDDDCNYFDEWVEDRKTYGIGDDCFSWSPEDPEIESTVTLSDENARKIYFEDLREKYGEYSILEPQTEKATVKDGKITLDITLGGHEVVFYQITQ